MTKILCILIPLLILGCSEKKREQKFSDEQIAQLELNNIKPIEIVKQGSVKLNLNEFLSEEEISIDSLVESVDYIALETTEKSLIAEINKLLCVEQYFFILDSDIGRNVFIFSKTGKFVKKISVGQGPDEIYNPADIAIDQKLEHLIVYNRKGFSFYDYNGNFIKRELVPFNFSNFRVLPNGYLFVMDPNRNNHLKEVSEMQVLITDRNFRIISAGLPFHYSLHNSYGITDYTDSFKEKVSFAPKFSNRIYQYVDSVHIREKFLLDFKKKELPAEFLKMETEELFKVLKNNDYYYFMGDFVENDSHEYLSLYNNYNKKTYQTLIFRDKNSNYLQGVNKILLNDLFPIFGYPLVGYEDKFIGAVNPNVIHNYISKKRKQGKIPSSFPTDVEEDSNPVLIRYKLKKNNFQ